MSSNFPESYQVGYAGSLQKQDPREYDGDPRGCVWIWEPPRPSALYKMAVDPSVGRTGWNRYQRSEADQYTNNGCIEIVRVGRNGEPDMQVCEYAAPVDAFEIGDTANILGRLYAGQDDDQCQAVVEITGPGSMTLQRMLELGYTNHFRWEYYGDAPATPTRTLALGWHATNRTNRDLWIKAARHIILGNVEIRSPWLAEEYADCSYNADKGWGENEGGLDDRVRAFNLAIWLANGWSTNIERKPERVVVGPAVDFQCSDMSMDEIREQWQDQVDRMGA